MSRLYICLAAVSGLLISVLSANAAVFSFSYAGDMVSGSGLFTTAAAYAGDTTQTYPVQLISGSITFGSDTSSITGLSTYAGADQNLYFPASAVPPTGWEMPPTFVSVWGISFQTSLGMYWNIANYNGYLVATSSTNPDGIYSSPYFILDSFTVSLVDGGPSAVPLPGAAVLFSSVLLLGGGAMRICRRKESAKLPQVV